MRSFLGLVLLLAIFNSAAKPAATVVGITGNVDWKPGENEAWNAAKLEQVLDEGQHVKTGRRSRTALLFTDNSQMRLNQNSLLIVKSVLDDQGQSTRFRLNQGRAWVKSKNIPDKLLMETPSSVAAIRGTDWDIEVTDTGTTRLTVLHGEVELSNEFGAVSISSGEQGIAELGKAPVKISIVNPQDRIQWVTQYQSDVVRLVMDSEIELEDETAFNEISRAITEGRMADVESLHRSYPLSVERDLIHADLFLYSGESAQAITVLTDSKFAEHQAIQIKKARARLIAGEPQYLEANNASSEVHIINGDIAVFEGDWRKAISHYEAAISFNPQNPFAYFGLGRVYAEREFTDLGLLNLEKAHQLQPNPVFQGEKATLLTYVSNFEQAQAEFSEAIAASPSNAVLFTGAGILALKQGDPQNAQELFLKASTLEPRFARVNVYLAIAQYQLGYRELAIESLSYAAELDGLDPLPYFLKSTIEVERFAPFQALRASQNAVERLPNLKSLNQLADDRNGSNNLGAAIANFGMNEWALNIAFDSYDPFWSASPLFLSNQIRRERYVTNSERYKGLLLDPTVFGASNRHPSLVKSPGHYYTVDGNTNHLRFGDTKSKEKTHRIGTNGLFVSPFPISYFARREEKDFDGAGLTAKPHLNTFGLGTNLSDSLRLFFFLEDGERDQNIGTNLTLFEQKQVAYGATYKYSPNWLLTALSFRIDEDATTTDMSSISSLLDFPPLVIETQTDNDQTTLNAKEQRSTHFRLNWKNGPNGIAIGYEDINHDVNFSSNANSVSSTTTLFDGLVISELLTETSSLQLSLDELSVENIFMNGRYQLQDNVYIDGIYRHVSMKSQSSQFQEAAGIELLDDSQSGRLSENLLSVGVTYQTNDHNKIKFARTEFIDSLAEVTLDNTFVAEIPFQTRYLRGGRKQTLWAAQWDYTGVEDTFLQLYAYRQSFSDKDPVLSGITRATNTITDLRNLSEQIDILFQDDYVYSEVTASSATSGKVRNLGGVYNSFLTPELAVYATYEWQDTENTEPGFTGQPITTEYKERTRVGLIYSSPHQFKIGLLADYYDYHQGDSVLRKDNWFWRITYAQEFFDKHLTLFSTYRYDKTQFEDSRVWALGMDLRF